MQDERQVEEHEHAMTPRPKGNSSASFLEQVPTLLVYAPIAFAMLGICYDVGYFARIDLDLFSLFSLSEHQRWFGTD